MPRQRFRRVTMPPFYFRADIFAPLMLSDAAMPFLFIAAVSAPLFRLSSPASAAMPPD